MLILRWTEAGLAPEPIASPDFRGCRHLRPALPERAPLGLGERTIHCRKSEVIVGWRDDAAALSHTHIKDPDSLPAPLPIREKPIEKTYLALCRVTH
jgi:hypothetical protein